MAQSLQSFIDSERERLERFRLHWEQKHKENPEAYPMQMEDGQEGLWDEMLHFFEKN